MEWSGGWEGRRQQEKNKNIKKCSSIVFELMVCVHGRWACTNELWTVSKERTCLMYICWDVIYYAVNNPEWELIIEHHLRDDTHF